MSVDLDPDQLRELVERAKARDVDAWESLYRHSYQRLLSYARRRLSSNDLAEDAVSETMLRAVRRFDRFTWQRAGYDAWMYGILRNVVLEFQRQPRRSERLVTRMEDPSQQSGPTWAGPEDHLDSVVDHGRLRNAFARLSVEDQEILELRLVGELTAEDAGVVVGKSAGAVRMAQSRALERLREAMAEVSDGE